MANLTLYGNNLTLYGNVLVLYPDGPEPVADDVRGGAWLPVIYVDRDGKPVDIEAKVEAAIKSAPEADHEEAEAAAEIVAAHMNDAKWIVANQMQREAEVLLQLLDKVDSYISEAIRQNIERAAIEADEMEAVAILLLAG